MRPSRKAVGAALAAALLAMVALVTVTPDNWHSGSVQARGGSVQQARTA